MSDLGWIIAIIIVTGAIMLTLTKLFAKVFADDMEIPDQTNESD